MTGGFITGRLIRNETLMPNPTSVHRPSSLDDALRYTTESGAVALAGGALLFGQNDLDYETVVDLQGVRELGQINAEPNGVTIGGAVTLQTVADSDLIMPFFKRSLVRSLPLNIRNAASIGESLLAHQPPREWLAALVASDAAVMRAFSDGETATDSVISLIDGSAVHSLREGVITAIFIPALTQRAALGAAFVARTPADEPIVNAATFVQLDANGRVDSAFVAVCGASDAPVVSLYLDTLVGQALDEAGIARAATTGSARVEPVGDYLGSADYRREMTRVIIQRALLDCHAALSA